MKTGLVISFLLLIYFSLSAQESEIMLETREGKLYGTLSIPEGKDSYPLVIIIAGSGPTDRDGNNPQMKNNALKYLADSLRENGVASLRYDKRGIGQSTESLILEKDIRIETYVKDASDWIDALNMDARFSKIFIAGHSEGSLIGILCARTNPFVKGLICLSGTSQPIGTVLRRQLKDYPDYLKKESYD
ncbi:MAG: alpha/beta hydrolase, partial [Odoribacter sp.]|nr:alpha/beta hydrolase [Odoribacter sp.]